MITQKISQVDPVAAEFTSIFFRRINDPNLCGEHGGELWYVEYRDEEWHNDFPVGIAYVSIVPKSAVHSGFQSVYYVLVNDQFRRRGIGRTLLKACRERWPDIYFIEGISKEGCALLKSFKSEASHA